MIGLLSTSRPVERCLAVTSRMVLVHSNVPRPLNVPRRSFLGICQELSRSDEFLRQLDFKSKMSCSLLAMSNRVVEACYRRLTTVHRLPVERQAQFLTIRAGPRGRP